MRRYFLVQKAKEANVVGILVGTLGVANYMDVIQRLKQVGPDSMFFLLISQCFFI